MPVRFASPTLAVGATKHRLASCAGMRDSKRARRPDRDTGRTWLAHHIANDVIDPRDPELTAAGVLDRMENSVDPDRWERGFAHYYETAQGVAA